MTSLTKETTFRRLCDEVGRRELKRLLSMCTEKQNENFNKVFESVEELPFESIESAIQLCERTVAKNQGGK